jgi:exopolysaccharide biosynthesis polyprenyl glycosylphosphotransferase
MTETNPSVTVADKITDPNLITIAYEYSQSMSDLRSPTFKRLRRGIGNSWLRVLFLIILDTCLLGGAWKLVDVQSRIGDDNNLALLPLLLAIQTGALAVQGLYRSGDRRRDYFRLFKTLSFAQLLFPLIVFYYGSTPLVSRETFLYSWLYSVSFVCLGRLVVDLGINQLRRKGTGRIPIFFIGRPEDKLNLVKPIQKQNRYEVVDSLTLDQVNSCDDCPQKALERIINSGATEVFISSWESVQKRMFLYWNLRNAGITIRLLPTESEIYTHTVKLEFLGGIPSVKLSPPVVTGTDFALKRLCDFVGALSFVILTFPIYVLTAIAIKLDSEGSIFYKQTRIGLHGKPFQFWKFRTMVPNADRMLDQLESLNESKDGIHFKVKNDPRITPLGKFLRRYSLDELPQMFNVILGDMSLVGPRPLSLRDYNNCAKHHLIRHQVIPGITGLWQVSGRSDILNFDDVVRLDTAYIENWTLQLDFEILLRTIVVVLGKRGAY